MRQLATPDITPVQKLGAALLAGLFALLALLKAFGVDIDEGQSTAIIGAATAFVAIAVAADAVIRHGRSNVAAAHLIANLDNSQSMMMGSGSEEAHVPPGAQR
jgi:hypothetical protein